MHSPQYSSTTDPQMRRSRIGYENRGWWWWVEGGIRLPSCDLSVSSLSRLFIMFAISGFAFNSSLHTSTSHTRELSLMTSCLYACLYTCLYTCSYTCLHACKGTHVSSSLGISNRFARRTASLVNVTLGCTNRNHEFHFRVQFCNLSLSHCLSQELTHNTSLSFLIFHMTRSSMMVVMMVGRWDNSVTNPRIQISKNPMILNIQKSKYAKFQKNMAPNIQNSRFQYVKHSKSKNQNQKSQNSEVQKYQKIQK